MMRAASSVGTSRILLADDQRRRRVLDVVEPALHGELAGGHAEVAEGEHGGIGRRRVPHAERDLGRLAGDLQGIKAFGDEFDHAGVIEIVPERVVESLKQRGVLRIGSGRLEVGNRQANFFYAQTRARAYPILSKRDRGERD